ncbi:hypothetical protein CK203_036004 [Vitis vinifera]|uniref:Uncharacterized protein n=1 Tax=Vitis vinifera TaxID=29760 RepID=A0A438HQW5_VITVI|nr:hypothetical protein CK203_036004 [Vitis vinifera]
MKTYNMKLNPVKCAFGVNAGKFLGFMVTQRVIEVNPNQIKAVMEMSAPKLQEGTAVSHEPTSCIGTLYCLIYRQVKVLLPHTEMS